ncbi:MAG: M23 family metallopeptidase [Synergistaceae bacterium]|jgi:murein DD-endopeptidase MepM/ murein hydrolase activator NlpD|nr:M23 family metallopeptidase [Synergistaceae bacterium]
MSRKNNNRFLLRLVFMAFSLALTPVFAAVSRAESPDWQEIVWSGSVERMKELEQICLEYGVLSGDVLRVNGYSESLPSEGEVLLVPKSKSALVLVRMEAESRKNGRAEPLVTVKLHGVPLSMRTTREDARTPQKEETKKKEATAAAPVDMKRISVASSDVHPLPSATVPASREAPKNMRILISGDEVVVFSGSQRAYVASTDLFPPPELPPLETTAPLTARVITPSAPPAGASEKMAWPVSGKVSSGFGKRGKRHFHAGLDLPMPKGTPILAVMDGTVLETATTKTPKYRGYGNLVLLDHGNGLVTMYAHCQSVSVKKGQTIKQGDVVALVGNTGRTTTCHVHFEVRKNGKPVNPLPLMAAR